MRVVQLSGMMDKYVGETEKHTAEVFRQASAAGRPNRPASSLATSPNVTNPPAKAKNHQGRATGRRS